MPLPDWFLESARALIRADSVSAAGNQAALAVLEPLYAKAGLPTRRFEWRESIDGAPESQHANLLAGPGGLASESESRALLEGESLPARAQDGLLLVTHTDTVPTGPLERWTETGGDPRALTEKGGFWFGLGVADVKLDALCKIAAAARLRGKKLSRPFWLLGTAAEEVGLRGARRFAQSDFFSRMRIRQVLCGEPSELQLIRAHKGYAVVRCTITDTRAELIGSQITQATRLDFQGKAAHSSTPHLGDNAIDRALRWTLVSGPRVLDVRGGASANTVPALCTLEVAGAHAAPEASAKAMAPRRAPDLWRALQTAGALEELWLSLVQQLVPNHDEQFDPRGAVGGLNLIASHAEPPAAGDTRGNASLQITLDARLLPQHDPDTLLITFEAAAKAWVERMGRGELSLSIEVSRNAGGMSLSDESPLVKSISQTLTRMGLDGTPRAKPTSTEAGVFARAGCEAIVLGPGRSTGNAHTANERIEVAQLPRAIDLYEAILLDLCG